MNPPLGKWVRFRIIVVGVTLILLFFSVTARFIYLQFVDGERLRELAQGECKKLCPVLPIRGSIVDRKGSELAISTFVQSLGAHPRRLPELNYLCQQLAPRLGMAPTEIRDILQKDRPFVWIKRHLTPQQAEAVQTFKEAQLRQENHSSRSGKDNAAREKSLEAMYLIPEARRFYPYRSLAGPVLGFCNIDSRGLGGLEYHFDEYLYGKPIKCLNLLDARGHIVVSREKEFASQTAGDNLVLTLDRTIQYIAEKQLAAGVEKWRAAAGLAIVARPQTGEILAMAQVPSFDPNYFYCYDQQGRQNRNLTVAFEPGSTFKIFTVAAALDAQVVRPTDRFHCGNGVFRIGNCGTIHDVHPYGSLSVCEIIKKSSNIGAAKVGLRVGGRRLDKYIQGFGFGQRTGICAPGESYGLFRAFKFCRSPIDRVTVNFGQGISVTAIQLTMALAALGNNGVLMKPLLVREILSQQGEIVKRFQPEPRRQVVSPQTARQMLEIMKTVTETGGTGTEAVPPGFTVAGKTGTAQKVIGGRYSHSKFNALFIGLVPAEQPVLAIIVVIDEPKGAIYGGVVAAPVFREIAARTMRYLGYYPQIAPTPQVVHQASLIPCSAKASPPPAQLAGGSGKVMPDFRGQTIRQVVRALHRAGIRCRIEGSGLAVAQQPEPGAPLSPEQICWIKFQPQL